MILKGRGVAKRQACPFVSVLKLITLRRRRFCGCGEVGVPLLDFHFPTAASSSVFRVSPGGKGTGRRGCGNVAISRFLRDSQGAGGRMENLPLVFQAFHGPAISTVFRLLAVQWKRGGTGDSLLHWRSKFIFARLIFRAHSVSLMALACLSNRAKLTPGFR